MSWIRHQIERYTACRDGGVAMMLGLSVIPIVIVIGLTFDIQRARQANTALQSAIDASVLAAARQMQLNVADTTKIKMVALDYFRVDMATASPDLDCPDPTVTVDDKAYSVELSAACKLPTTFAGIVGQEFWDLGANASAQSSVSRIDLALMLDVSGSMDGARIAALKDAANEAVDVLLGPNTGMGGRIALAPYASSVNAGSYAEAAVGPDFKDEDDDDEDNENLTCVTERKGKAAKKDDAPGKGTYVGYDADECPTATIIPLTADADILHAEINALSADGNTAGQLGIAWSWYLVSDEWDAFWGRDDTALDDGMHVTKAVILMTDGEFNQSYDSTQGNSVNQAKVMCKRMRDENVIVYSVAFQAPSAGKSVLQDCATSEETYFEPTTAAELSDVYRTIASRLGQLRLTN